MIASSFAFVEIARRWNDIAGVRFHIHQLAAFLEQPPEWFSIAPVDEDLVEFFCEVPSTVATRDVTLQPTEWTDAVHVATVFSRGVDVLFATTDGRLRSIVHLDGRLV